MDKLKLAKVFRCSARQLLLILGLFMFIFSLLSGTEELGGGFKGILHNSPNTIPWLILLILLLAAWKNELIGGILIIIFSFFSFYFFVFRTEHYNLFVIIISCLILIFGIFFILSWYIRRE